MNKLIGISATLLIMTLLTACGKPKDGLNGADGKDGHDGKDGSSCTVVSVAPNSVAPNGGSMISCTDGTNSLVLNGSNGSDGKDGKNGSNGSNGSNGRDGSPGTVVSSVQFCPGTTSYPAKFNEVGFCINNKLYAVYSANGGFMAYIPPGTYSSNGINSSCSFQVRENCEIVR